MKVSKIDPAIIQRILEEYPTTETMQLARKYGVNISNIRSLANQYGVRKQVRVKDICKSEMTQMLRDYYLRGYADACGDITTDTFKRFDKEIRERIAIM